MSTTHIGIRDVARRAGVSMATVSNVLNNPGRVSATTMTRVLEVMREVGFVPNQLARQLRTGDNTTIGMIVLNVANPFFANLAHACEAVAELKGFTVVLGSSDQLDEREERYLDLFEQQRVRGMIVAPLTGLTEGMRRLQRRGMPLVLFDVGSDDPSFCSVALDGREGGYLAARHLIETGRTHIAFLGGPLRQVEDRWYGAMRACAEVSGVKLSRIDTAETAFADGHAVGPRLEAMPSDERPDAIMAANDSLALGLLQSLALSPIISVPHDVAVMGYDDIEYAAAAMVPLSTVRQPIDQLAAESLRLVLAESGPDHQHESVKLTPELVIRKSTPVRS